MKKLIYIVIVLALASCKTTIKDSSSNSSLSNADIYLTEKGTTNKITKVKSVSFTSLIQPEENKPTIILDANKTFQTIVGFGGALTDASAETFYKLPKKLQDQILTAYFDTENGIGYSLCRTHIHSCDFSSSSYTYNDTKGDTLLTNFNISHDKKYRIPFIKKAIETSKNGITFFASPWSPPAWMKTNNNMLQGGKLKPEYFQTWANYYVKFMSEYAKEGINIWGLTVQNEPMASQKWESCIFTGEEERDFVKNYLGPTIKKSKFSDTKLIVWDHNRGIMYQRAKVVYDDPEAAKYVWGLGFHWYVGNHFDNVKQVREAYLDKNLLFTEGCVYPFNIDSLNEWHWGETYGESIINDLNNGVVGWVDWNVLLDETGGPNHVQNFCYAPIIGNTKKGELYFMNSFYYMGHFSKFIRPGAKRIICSSNSDDLLATAFVNTDKTIAVVLMNKKTEAIRFDTWIENKAIETTIPAHSIITIKIN